MATMPDFRADEAVAVGGGVLPYPGICPEDRGTLMQVTQTICLYTNWNSAVHMERGCNGTQGFDAESLFSSSQIKMLSDKSPYLVAMADAASGSTSQGQTYVQNLLDQGFYVGIYRGYYAGMFDSSPSSVGSSHAQQCIDVANGFSGSKGMTFWCDLEGATSFTTAQDIIDYANAFNATCQSDRQ